MKERLLRAYFTDGLNVGDPDVLADWPPRSAWTTTRSPLPRWPTVAAAPRSRPSSQQATAARHHRGADLRLRSAVVGAGAQDPETFLRVLERVAELEAAASEPA